MSVLDVLYISDGFCFCFGCAFFSQSHWTPMVNGQGNIKTHCLPLLPSSTFLAIFLVHVHKRAQCMWCAWSAHSRLSNKRPRMSSSPVIQELEAHLGSMYVYGDESWNLSLVPDYCNTSKCGDQPALKQNWPKIVSDVSQAHQGFGSCNIIPLKRAQVTQPGLIKSRLTSK